MGVGTAALIRSAEGSSAVVNFILLPMAFLSGAFGEPRLPAGARGDRRRAPAEVLHRPAPGRLPRGRERLERPRRACGRGGVGARRARCSALAGSAGSRVSVSESGEEGRPRGCRSSPTGRLRRRAPRTTRARGPRQLRHLRGPRGDGGRDRRARSVLLPRCARSRSSPSSGTSSTPTSRDSSHQVRVEVAADALPEGADVASLGTRLTTLAEHWAEGCISERHAEFTES